jgi:TolA-binding protein
MRKITAFTVLFLFFAAHSAISAENPKPVKTAKVEKKYNPPLRIPREYQVLEKAKKTVDFSKLTLAQIVETQNQLRALAWTTTNKSVEKEIDELYWFYEITRAEKIGGTAAVDAWFRALQSLNQFKWIYVWTEKTSDALMKSCKRNQKKKSKKKKESSPSFAESLLREKCDYIAKKVFDAFPKGAMETQTLKELLPEAAGMIDVTSERYDRLGQTYSEKKEKDEEAFAEVLDLYLNHQDGDLEEKGNAFIEEYPKSMLRFRAMFLMAERQFARKKSKEAEKSYQQIIDQIPYSYYAIVAGERLGVMLTEKITADDLPEMKDLSELRLNLQEKDAFCKVENLIQLKKEDPVAMELEQFARVRSYPTFFLTHLFQKAHQAQQDLAGFRFASEILQRKGEAPMVREFVNMVFPDRFAKEIADHSKNFKIDPLLVVSLMKQESGFKRSILSSSGAVGLMQLMPFTALEMQKDLYLRKLRDPSKNIEIGTKYLAQLLNDRFGGNVVYALAGYNAGPHRVGKWKKEAKSDWGMQEFIEAIPYKETRDYVMSILRNRYWYQYRKGMKPQSVFEAWRTP